MENTRISTTGSFPDELNASKLIMRPEQVAEEHFDPCLVQMDCRYDEAPLREFVRVPENESPHPQAGAVRPGATPPSHHPSRQSTSPNPHTLPLPPAAPTSRSPRPPLRAPTPLS